MNYVDLIIILAVAIGALYGIIKGVICQLGSLCGFILGIVLSRLFGEEFSAILQNSFDMPTAVSDVVAHILLFVAGYVACVLVVKLIRRFVHWVTMGWIDRLAGMLFGAVKWLFVLSLVFNLIHLVDPEGKLIPKEALTSSNYYEFTLRFAPAVFSIAQEQWFDGTKEQPDLFIPSEGKENTLLYCKN